MNKEFKDFKVNQMSNKLAMEVLHISKSFPQIEQFSLTDQIRRYSQSVCGNIAEANRKCRYPKHFTSKITGADGEASETTVWLDFALDCGYTNSEIHKSLIERYDEVGKMLGGMANHPEKFLPKNIKYLD